MNATEVFESLEGKWRFERDVSGKDGGKMQGTAVFRACDTGVLHYAEHGVFHQEGNPQPFKTHREYLYRMEENGQLCVYFKDGESMEPARLFHEIVFREGSRKATGGHYCKPDQYDAAYEFLSPKEFLITYQVKGPRKDYSSRTLFTKIQGI